LKLKVFQKHFWWLRLAGSSERQNPTDCMAQIRSRLFCETIWWSVWSALV